MIQHLRFFHRLFFRTNLKLSFFYPAATDLLTILFFFLIFQIYKKGCCFDGHSSVVLELWIFIHLSWLLVYVYFHQLMRKYIEFKSGNFWVNLCRKKKVWKDKNRAIEFFYRESLIAKTENINRNPVVDKIVCHEQDYLFSSACNYYILTNVLEIDWLTPPVVTASSSIFLNINKV